MKKSKKMSSKTLVLAKKVVTSLSGEQQKVAVGGSTPAGCWPSMLPACSNATLCLTVCLDC